VDFVSNSLGYAGTILQVILLVLIIRGPLSRYFPLFLYVLSSVAIYVAEGWVIQKWGADREHYYPVYWGGGLFLGLQLFLVMIILTLRALEGSPLRSKVLRFMGVVLVVVLVVPFVAFESRVGYTKWYDSTWQLLTFGAAVMNLALWGALLVSKLRDRQLLTVSAGLGVALAGAAVTIGMRNFTDEDSVGRVIADYSHRLLDIGSALILCYAFRPQRKSISIPTDAPV